MGNNGKKHNSIYDMDESTLMAGQDDINKDENSVSASDMFGFSNDNISNSWEDDFNNVDNNVFRDSQQEKQVEQRTNSQDYANQNNKGYSSSQPNSSGNNYSGSNGGYNGGKHKPNKNLKWVGIAFSVIILIMVLGGLALGGLRFKKEDALNKNNTNSVTIEKTSRNDNKYENSNSKSTVRNNETSQNDAQTSKDNGVSRDTNSSKSADNSSNQTAELTKSRESIEGGSRLAEGTLKSLTLYTLKDYNLLQYLAVIDLNINNEVVPVPYFISLNAYDNLKVGDKLKVKYALSETSNIPVVVSIEVEQP